jgi:excisionase family DNA binding protein
MFADIQRASGYSFAVPEAIRVHTAAKRIGRSPRTIRRYIEQGILPAMRLGQRIWLIHPADIEWIRNRRYS